jgi:hypothetical protein
MALRAFNVIPLSSTLEFLYSGPSDKKHYLDYTEEIMNIYIYIYIYIPPLLQHTSMLKSLTSFNFCFSSSRTNKCLHVNLKQATTVKVSAALRAQGEFGSVWKRDHAACLHDLVFQSATLF